MVFLRICRKNLQEEMNSINLLQKHIHRIFRSCPEKCRLVSYCKWRHLEMGATSLSHSVKQRQALRRPRYRLRPRSPGQMDHYHSASRWLIYLVFAVLNVHSWQLNAGLILTVQTSLDVADGKFYTNNVGESVQLGFYLQLHEASSVLFQNITLVGGHDLSLYPGPTFLTPHLMLATCPRTKLLFLLSVNEIGNATISKAKDIPSVRLQQSSTLWLHSLLVKSLW